MQAVVAVGGGSHIEGTWGVILGQRDLAELLGTLYLSGALKKRDRGDLVGDTIVALAATASHQHVLLLMNLAARIRVAHVNEC